MRKQRKIIAETPMLRVKQGLPSLMPPRNQSNTAIADSITKVSIRS